MVPVHFQLVYSLACMRYPKVSVIIELHVSRITVEVVKALAEQVAAVRFYIIKVDGIITAQQEAFSMLRVMNLRSRQCSSCGIHLGQSVLPIQQVGRFAMPDDKSFFGFEQFLYVAAWQVHLFRREILFLSHEFPCFYSP